MASKHAKSLHPSQEQPGLCINHTNGKDSHVRLRTSSGMIAEDGLRPKPNYNPKPELKPNTKPNPPKETKERSLEKRKKRENLPGLNYKTPQTHQSACNNSANCARCHIIPLPFIAQHVIDKKLVLSLTHLSFLLVSFRLYQQPEQWSKEKEGEMNSDCDW